jgi:hypothetical protein
MGHEIFTPEHIGSPNRFLEVQHTEVSRLAPFPTKIVLLNPNPLPNPDPLKPPTVSLQPHEDVDYANLNTVGHSLHAHHWQGIAIAAFPIDPDLYDQIPEGITVLPNFQGGEFIIADGTHRNHWLQLENERARSHGQRLPFPFIVAQAIPVGRSPHIRINSWVRAVPPTLDEIIATVQRREVLEAKATKFEASLIPEPLPPEAFLDDNERQITVDDVIDRETGLALPRSFRIRSVQPVVTMTRDGMWRLEDMLAENGLQETPVHLGGIQ